MVSLRGQCIFSVSAIRHASHKPHLVCLLFFLLLLPLLLSSFQRRLEPAMWFPTQSVGRALFFGLLASQETLSATLSSTSSDPADGLQSASTTASATTGSIGTVTISGIPSTYSVQYTPPASVDVGQNILPNINDPQAVNAQDVCPGYNATNVQVTENGMTATLVLAGSAVSNSRQ